MAITTKEAMFGDNAGNGLQAPFSNTAPAGYGVNNRAVGFGEQLTSAVANRTHYALALNDEDLDSRLTVIETAGLDGAYRQGALAVPGGGRVVTKDGGAVEIQSAQASLRDDDRADALMRVDASGDAITSGIGYDAIIDGTVLLGRRTFSGSALTVIASTSGILNPASAGGTVVAADTGDTFHVSGDTDLLRGVDLLEITDTVYAGLYRLHAFMGADDQVHVRNLDGTSPAFAANTAVTFHLRRPISALGLLYFPGNSLQSTRGNLMVGTPGARTVLDLIPMATSAADTTGASAALRVFHRLVDGTAEVRSTFDRYGVLVATPNPAEVAVADVDLYATGLLPSHMISFDGSVSTTHMGLAVRGLVDAVRYDVSCQGPLITPNKNYTSGTCTATFTADSETGTVMLTPADFTGDDTSDIIPLGGLVRLSGASSGNGLYVVAQRIADNELILQTLAGATAVFPTVGTGQLQFYTHQAIGALPAFSSMDETGVALPPVKPSALFAAGGADGATALALTAPRSSTTSGRYLIRGVVGEASITNSGREVFSVDTEGVMRAGRHVTSRRGFAASPVSPVSGFTGLTLIADNIQDGGYQRIRTYVSPEGTIWETINAFWDGTDWERDIFSPSCAIVRGAVTTQRAAVQLLYRTGSGATWPTSDWATTMNFHSDYIEMFSASGGAASYINPTEPLTPASATVARTLYPGAITKTWGRIAVSEGPVVAVGSGMNISAVSLQSVNTQIRITLTTPFAANGFCPFVNLVGITGGRTVQADPALANRITVTKYNGTSAEAFASEDVLYFHAVGIQ